MSLSCTLSSHRFLVPTVRWFLISWVLFPFPHNTYFLSLKQIHILHPCTTHSLSHDIALPVSAFNFCHVSHILLPLLSSLAFCNSHLNTRWAPSTYLSHLNISQRPECVCVFATAALLLKLSFLISCFGFRLCRCLPLPGLVASFLPLYPGFFFLFFLFAPASSSQLLTIACLCQHYFLAHFQSFTFIPQCPCWWPIWSLSCMYFCPQCLPSACGSDSIGQWSALLLWMQFVPQITVVHATTSLSSWILHQSYYFSLLYCLRTRGLRSVLAFPLLLREAQVTTS